MDHISLYCDGGCRGNQARTNVGGWGVLLQWRDHEREFYGGERNTTNNKMELTACIEGLRAIKRKDYPTDVYTDSAYVIGGVTSWIASWQRNGWVNASKKPVANKELWQTLVKERDAFSHVTFHKVKGHADNEGNNRADALANRAMDELEQE